MPNPLTSRQKQVLNFINQTIRIQGILPHLWEIAEGLDFQPLSNFHLIIINFEIRGYLQRRFSTEKISHSENSVKGYHPLTTQEGRTLFSCNGSLADTRKNKSNYIAEDLDIKNTDYKVLGVAVSAIIHSIGSRKSLIMSWRSNEHED